MVTMGGSIVAAPLVVEGQQRGKVVRRPIRPESRGGRPFESGCVSSAMWKGKISRSSLAGATET